MSDPHEYLTKEKYNALAEELERLKTEGRRKVAESLEYTKSLGDLSENAEYQEARENQANIEDRIVKLEAMLKSAVIVKMHHTEAVDVGSIVTLLSVQSKSKITYKIVGSEEANPDENKLSLNSPLGRELLGRKKGDTLTVKTPGGEASYTIAHID